MESLPGTGLREGDRGLGCVAERGRECNASKFFGLRRVKVWECELWAAVCVSCGRKEAREAARY